MAGLTQQFRGRELLGAMSRAKAQALSEIGHDLEARMKARAHVVSGEMRAGVFAEVFVAPSGQLAIAAGSTSDHAYWEVIKRGGAHDFIHPAVDAVSHTIPGRLAAALRAEGL